MTINSAENYHVGRTNRHGGSTIEFGEEVSRGDQNKILVKVSHDTYMDIVRLKMSGGSN